MLVIINNTHSFEYDPGKRTLLEALEDRGAKIEYNCRAGFCGACRVKLIEGEVGYSQAPLAYVQTDEILPCKAIPKGKFIHIEIDPGVMDKADGLTKKENHGDSPDSIIQTKP